METPPKSNTDDRDPNIKNNLSSDKKFFGYLPLSWGIWDVAFGSLMAMSYFRQIEIPLCIAGGIRIFSGFWCFAGLLLKNRTMMNLFLLTLLFNNCLVLSVCVGFAIIITSSSTIVCNLPPKPIKLGEVAMPCPLIHRKGFWETLVTLFEFLLYLYYIYITIIYLQQDDTTTLEHSIHSENFPLLTNETTDVVYFDRGDIQKIEPV